VSHEGHDHQPAEARIRPLLLSLVEVTRQADARARKAGGAQDPEAIHDLRVSLRRLRTMMRAARPVFGKKRMQTLGEELRAVAATAGAVRDDEVLRETLGDLKLEPTVRAEVEAWLARRERIEAQRRAGVTRLLAEGRLTRALEAVAQGLTKKKKHPHDESLSAHTLAHEAIAQAEENIRAIAPTRATPAALMHELRIRYKRLRYTAELFAPELGDAALSLEKRAAKMQKRLGELHDLDEAAARIRRATSLSPDTRATLLVTIGDRRIVVAAQCEALGRSA
jgi:CHAD domain-containing protein